MDKDSVSRPAVLQHVSQNIRQLRQALGLSQTLLAERSGVSRRMLVAIEGGDRNVSLNTLDRLAEALGVEFSDLVQAPGRDRTRIEELAWHGHSPGSCATLLSSAPASRGVELWEWRLEAGERYESEPDPEGWSEQLFVIEGRLTLLLNGERRLIEAGQFATYPSNCHYAYLNEDTATVRFVRNVVF